MSALQNLFVLYPPGVGGNHLANMLSLGKNFAKRFGDDSYATPVKHNNVLAHHFSMIPQFDVDVISKNLKVLKQQNNVFAGHWLSYHAFKKSGLVKHFVNRKFFCIQFPDPDSKAFARLKKMGLVSDQGNYLTAEITALYKCECLSLLCEEPKSDFYYVWPHLLFDNDFSVTIKDLQKQGFEIDLDLDRVQMFHDQWLSNLKKENSK